MLIPEEYKSDLDRIRSDLMEKVADGPAELANYVKFTLIDSGFSKEECQKLAYPTAAQMNAMGEAFGKGIAGVMKPAAKNKPVAESLMKGLAWAAGLIGITSAAKAVGGVIESQAANQTYNDVIRDRKDLKQDKNMETYFQTIKKFAPTVARDQHALTTALEHAHEFGRVDYPMIKDLVQIESGTVGSPTQSLQGASSVAGIAKIVMPKEL